MNFFWYDWTDFLIDPTITCLFNLFLLNLYLFKLNNS